MLLGQEWWRLPMRAIEVQPNGKTAPRVQWHVAVRPGKRCALDKTSSWGSLLDKAEEFKASVRAKVKHLFRAFKCQFRFNKVRYKALAKSTAQLMTLFALSNLWMARSTLMQTAKACVRLQCGRPPQRSLEKLQIRVPVPQHLVPTRFAFHRLRCSTSNSATAGCADLL